MSEGRLLEELLIVCARHGLDRPSVFKYARADRLRFLPTLVRIRGVGIARAPRAAALALCHSCEQLCGKVVDRIRESVSARRSNERMVQLCVVVENDSKTFFLIRRKNFLLFSATRANVIVPIFHWCAHERIFHVAPRRLK